MNENLNLLGFKVAHHRALDRTLARTTPALLPHYSRSPLLANVRPLYALYIIIITTLIQHIVIHNHNRHIDLKYISWR